MMTSHLPLVIPDFIPPYIRFDSDISHARSHLDNMIGPGGTICHIGLKYKTHDKSYANKRRLRRTSHLSVSFQNKNNVKQFPAELAFHFAWKFLSIHDKILLCQTTPVISCYASLRQKTTLLSRKDIKDIIYPRDHKKEVRAISTSRSTDIAILLLLCDFDVGKLIRLLQGQYTGDFLDFPLIDRTLNSLSTIPIKKGEPRHDFHLLHKIYHDGAPSSGQFTCNRDDMLKRNLYDNHSAAHPHFDEIEPKIASDIQKSYALACPRWTLHFIDGLLLAAIGWASRMKNGKIKGRQVNDPSFHINNSNEDTGAANDQICLDKGPFVYYQTAFQRALERAYNLRISHPLDDIITLKNDLLTAFRRVRYNPDASCAHCFVFRQFLIIPVGLVFGARDSPGIFCQVSEIRAFASQHFSSLGLPIPDRTLIDTVEFTSDQPQPEDITPAFADSKQTGTNGEVFGPQPTFVDDTIIIELRNMIRRASIHSILAAVLFIGSPLYVDEPISSEKFEKFFSHTNELLGFIIDTREMVVKYPLDKKEDLLFLLNQEQWELGRTYRVRNLASILGKLRNLGQILPFGVHLSINLQLSLSSFIKTSIAKVTKTPHATMRSTMRTIWNPYRRLHLSKRAIKDLQFLSQLLSSAPKAIWCRPISLVIARDPNFIAYSDACNNGIGGYSPLLDFQWRDLIQKIYTDRELHINTKEFVALFINVYLSMISFIHIRKKNLLPQNIKNLDGYIFSFLCDNTTAISWMLHSS